MVVRDGCAAATAQEHDTCMGLVFPRMAWVASVDDVINAIRGDHSGETAGSTPFGESWMVSVLARARERSPWRRFYTISDVGPIGGCLVKDLTRLSWQQACSPERVHRHAGLFFTNGCVPARLSLAPPKVLDPQERPKARVTSWRSGARRSSSVRLQTISRTSCAPQVRGVSLTGEGRVGFGQRTGAAHDDGAGVEGATASLHRSRV